MVYEFRRSSDTLVDLEFCTPSLIGTPLVSLLYAVHVPQVIGKVGTVVGIAEGGDLKVRYSTENLLCNICAEAVVKVGTQPSLCIHLSQVFPRAGGHS